MQIKPMFRTWSNVLTKPGEAVFVVERSKPAATLKTALVWILLVGLIAVLLDILLDALREAWVIPPDQLEFNQPPPPNLYPEIFGRIYSWHLNLPFEIVKMYGWLWAHSGLLDLAGEFVYSALRYFFGLGVPTWIQNIGKVLLRPVTFLAETGVYYCIATFWGGRGQFGRYAYLRAAIAVPFILLHSLLGFLPLAVYRLVAVLFGSSSMISPGTTTTTTWMMVSSSPIPSFSLLWRTGLSCPILPRKLNTSSHGGAQSFAS